LRIRATALPWVKGGDGAIEVVFEVPASEHVHQIKQGIDDKESERHKEQEIPKALIRGNIGHIHKFVLQLELVAH
jgi:hypothetical protein